MIELASKTLKDVFGFNEFRPQQKAIISNILAGRHTLAILPTGGGKSICYQIPALLFDGVTLVVSPLISLMQDQVRQLQELNVACCMLNSALSAADYQQNIQAIKQRQIKLVFLAPETLLQASTLNLFSKINVACVAIDEAHCISEWGHDFRPEYRQLHQLTEYFPKAIKIALTATATPRVRDDIKNQLGIAPDSEFIASFDRPNLFIEVQSKDNPFLQCKNLLDQHPKQSGIIYCQSRKQVDELSHKLALAGYSVGAYHAGLSNDTRAQCQEGFIRDDIQIIVATVAFGMGINKPDVRFVLHYDLPKNIESYYQQIGRAGRDGEAANCRLLFAYGDIHKVRFFIEQLSQEQERRIASGHLNQMLALCETEDCRRIPLLGYFAESCSQENCQKCDNCCTEQQQKTDLTVAAQKFLSCVYRTGSRFGGSHIIDVLRGSNAEKVLQNQHNLLSTYNIGNEYSKKQWLLLSRQIIQKGLLLQDEQFGSLRLSAEGAAVLKGKQSFFGRIQEESKTTAKTQQLPQNVEAMLLQLLKNKRKELADAGNLPPYAVFSDRTLHEMASYFPRSEQSLLQIHGVGQAKLAKYADRFLAIISAYCDENRLAEVATGRTIISSASIKPSSAGSKMMTIAEEFDAGASITELAQRHKIQSRTVLNHLQQFVQQGHQLQQAQQLISNLQLTPAQIELALSTFKKVGSERLKPIYDILAGQASYDDVNLLRIYFLYCKTDGHN
ncbi:MAG: ATP-dependent DNA helicase RecQ [Paraglaciecola sp.]